MNSHKILITGFLHSGTTILRAKFSDCENVYSQIHETQLPEQSEYEKYLESGKEFFLWKDPIIRNAVYNSVFPDRNVFLKDTHLIFLVRNPFFVFSSLQRRDVNIVKHWNHTFEDWERSAYFFLKMREEKHEGTHTIKYEEFFDENYQNLKKIMSSIGLKYDNNIFLERKKEYYHDKERSVPLEQPTKYDWNSPYRVWQINQDFQNFNLRDEVKLTPDLYEKICNSQVLKLLGYEIIENNPI